MQHPARDLSELRRVEYLTVVASMLHADGQVAPAELGRLREIARILELPVEAGEKIFAALRFHDPATAHELARSFRDDPMRFALLIDVILIAFADGRVDEGESKEVALVANLLGVAPAEAALVGRYVEGCLEPEDDKDLGLDLAQALGKAEHGYSIEDILALYNKLRHLR